MTDRRRSDAAEQIEALLQGLAKPNADTRLRAAVERLDAGLSETPAGSLRARLLASCHTGDLLAYVSRAARFLDVSEEASRELLKRCGDDPAGWPQHPFDGLALMPLELGPRHESAAGMVLRLEPGAEIPEHAHRGDEWGLILSGALADTLEDEKGPGDLVYRTPEMVHRVWNPGSVPALLLNVIYGGYDWSPG